ncbi:MAG: 50S ribosomal protein L6 [bacterium]
MSRVGIRPIDIPQGVEFKVDGNEVFVKGPRGTLRRKIHKDIIVERDGGSIRVKRPSDSRLHRSLHGLTRTLIANMVEGVVKGFQKTLRIEGVGYRAQMQGRNISLQVGFSHPVLFEVPEGIDVSLEGSNIITVKGIDKELVGRVAAEIRAIKKVEPYQGKGIMYSDEVVRRKAGKTAV